MRSREEMVGLLRSMAKFGAVGVLNTGVDYGFFWLLTSVLAVWVPAAQACSYTAGAICSFLVNGIWTFQRRASADEPWGAMAVKFAVVNLAGLGLSTLLVTWLWPMFGVWVAKICATGLLFFYGYAASRLWVFRTSVLETSAGK
jgi:putative flippase GtrA